MARQHLTEQLAPIEIEELYACIRKALGISLALAEKMSGDDHDTFAAAAISDNLTKAREIMEVKEARHG